jgi:hypothetical protein
MPLVRTLTDSSGRIEIGVFQDQATTSGPKHEVTVVVDPDMLAVGGGAIGSPNPGGLLTASRPSSGEFRAWLVASTDHLAPDAHRLEGFAFGLKIAGMTRAELLAQIRLDTGEQSAAHHPNVSVHLPAGFLLISGGFEVIPNDDANLATATYPEFQRGWRSASKDHFAPSLAGLKTHAIGIKEVLPGRPTTAVPEPPPVGRIVVDTATQVSDFSTRPEAKVELDGDFALTGIGALVRWTDPGCLLWKLAPWFDNNGTDVQGVEAAAKDHIAPSRATLQAWAIGIKLQEDPCL